MPRPDFLEDGLAAWVDREYDDDRASDGVSRYGQYLRDRAKQFDDLDLDLADPDRDGYNRTVFARLAWAIANGPIMSPGLVARHPRVTGVTTETDDWDYANLIVTAELISELPAGMGSVLGYRWYGLDRTYSGGYQWPDRSRAKEPLHMALPALTLVFPVPAADLPAPALDPNGLLSAAFGAVDAIVDHANRKLRPALILLDPPGSQR